MAVLGFMTPFSPACELSWFLLWNALPGTFRKKLSGHNVATPMSPLN